MPVDNHLKEIERLPTAVGEFTRENKMKMLGFQAARVVPSELQYLKNQNQEGKESTDEGYELTQTSDNGKE